MPLKVLQILAKYWKAFAVLILCAACYVWGAKANPPQEKIVYQDRVVAQAQTDDQKTNHTKTVTTTTKKPDGSVVTTTVTDKQTTEDKTKDVTKQETTTEKASVPVASPQKSYSLGLSVDYMATVDGLADIRHPDYTVDVGYRLIGDFWLQGHYDIQQNMVGIGLRYEW